jgi:class 3 adenylate cyclase
MPAESDAQARSGALPTGTVTFLFTDIEGSAERWERHREAMKAAVARHE